MPRKKIAFRCYHTECANDPPTELVIDVLRGRAVGAGKKEKVVYCARNHLNVITLPDTWNTQGPILGDGETGGSSGTPVLQGRRD
jgi:hypothetical protein